MPLKRLLKLLKTKIASDCSVVAYSTVVSGRKEREGEGEGERERREREREIGERERERESVNCQDEPQLS